MKNLSIIEVMMVGLIILITTTVFTSCGYSSRNNELIGQVKVVQTVTPLLCFDRTDIHFSLGVMRNGTGSVSTHDITATVYDKDVIKTLKLANETGAVVKLVADEARVRFCADATEITTAEIVK